MAKSQWVRAADVLLLGPLTIYGAVRGGGPMPPALRAASAAYGAATIAYNARNWWRTRQLRR